MHMYIKRSTFWSKFSVIIKWLIKTFLQLEFIPKRQLNNESGFKVTNNLSLGKKNSTRRNKVQVLPFVPNMHNKSWLFFLHIDKTREYETSTWIYSELHISAMIFKIKITREFRIFVNSYSGVVNELGTRCAGSSGVRGTRWLMN